MNRIFTVLLILLLAISVFPIPVFAQDNEDIDITTPPETSIDINADVVAENDTSPYSAVVIENEDAETAEIEVVPVPITESETPVVPTSILNNQFYLESVRLTKLAQDTYEYGDYEASAGFAEEAIRYALLSDEYVADQLIAEAKRLVDWADFYNIAERYPNNVQLGKDHYETAVAFQTKEEWNEASDSAMKSIEVLSVLQAGTGTGIGSTVVVIVRPNTTDTRNQYTVRTWAVERDCFWVISGYDWVYGDPWKWRTLYEANKHKIPDPNNPDLIEPGTVLDIPR